MTWYAFAHDVAYALTQATPAMYTSEKGKPEAAALRRALFRWAFNAKQRDSPPDDVARVLRWVADNTAPVSELSDPALARRVLDLATTRLDGKRSAANVARRNRMILANAMDYAVSERKPLETNPIRDLKWSVPKTSTEVDRRSVINPRQACALLSAVGAQQPSGPRLVAFFAVMYYSALRPEEAISLTRSDVTLPDLVWDEDGQEWQEPGEWCELHFREPTPDAGRERTDDGGHREARKQLKHRAEGLGRRVPGPLELTVILRAHLRDHVADDPDARLFTGVRGGDLPTIASRRAWRQARRRVLTDQQHESPLARQPYDLRHAVDVAQRGSAADPGGPSGRATRWTCCCGSTRRVSKARTRSPSDGSSRRWPETSARIRHRWPPRAGDGRTSRKRRLTM
ncbi:hypothetical protein [Actinoallomurus acaciae]|uniref:Integrase n=1 Tax=Actinoallomurus acaciae TaxID=502577 RepID=A0ABV5Y8T8_9ACTN